MATFRDFTAEEFKSFGLKLDNPEVENVHSLTKEVTQQLIDDAEYLFNDSIAAVHHIRSDVWVPQTHWQLISMPSLLIESPNTRTKARLDMLKITELVDFKSLSDAEAIETVLKWLVHMEWMSLYMFSLSRNPIFLTSEVRLYIFSTVMLTESLERPKLYSIFLKRSKRCAEDYKADYQVIVSVLTDGWTISTARASTFMRVFRASGGDKLPKTAMIIEKIDESGETIWKADDVILQDCFNLNRRLLEVFERRFTGSERARRVFINRINYMARFDKQFCVISRPELDHNLLNWESGMIPLDDAVLIWILENRREVQKLVIRIQLNKKSNTSAPINVEDPYLSLFMTVLINKELI